MISEEWFRDEQVVDDAEEAGLWRVWNDDVVAHAAQAPGHVDAEHQEHIQTHIDPVRVVENVRDNKHDIEYLI